MREPKYNCPLIDAIINDDLTTLSKAIDGYNQIDDVDQLKEIINSIDTLPYYVTQKLEQIRSNVVSLRDWGRYYSTQTEELQVENNCLKDEILDLKRCILQHSEGI